LTPRKIYFLRPPNHGIKPLPRSTLRIKNRTTSGLPKKALFLITERPAPAVHEEFFDVD
jgi:hypothetical protein